MMHNSPESNRRLVSRREDARSRRPYAAAKLVGSRFLSTPAVQLNNPEITVIAFARAFSRAFPANSIRAECLRQLPALGAAILFVSLLVASYGLDLSPGFF
jgi:hypothetical protein